MTSSPARKPAKRARQCITRNACEPCRQKRAKCDGKEPCGRCKTRSLDCHFAQRTWTSKRSLQDEIASLREKVNRRNCVLDAISTPDCSGEGVVSMLRQSRVSYDDMCDKVQDAAMEHGTRHNECEPCDCEACYSPATTNSEILSTTSGLSPFSFMDQALSDEAMSQPFSTSEQSPQQRQQEPDPPQQQMAPMQSIPWASGADANTFGNMFNGISNMRAPSTDVASECPTITDPMLWFQVTSSSDVGQRFVDSWQGLPCGSIDLLKPKTAFPCMG